MTDSSKLSPAGKELVEALGEVRDHIHGKKKLPSRVVRVPDTVDVKAIRKSLGMTQKAFSDQFGFDLRSLQDWEQGRRQPTGHTRAYLLVISKEPKAVKRALKAA